MYVLLREGHDRAHVSTTSPSVRDGDEIKDKLEAPSEDVLRNQLLLRNLEVKQVKQKKTFNELELSPQRVPRQEIMHFSRQMAAFVRTGIPITDALEVVEEGSGNKRFRQILADDARADQNGVPFSEALAEHAAVFPPYYIGILRSAELTGQLDTALEQLSGYIERDLEAQEQDQGRDGLPDGDLRHVDRAPS